MPNHVTTICTVTGPEADIVAFCERHIIRHEDKPATDDVERRVEPTPRYFAFATIIPKPAILEGTVSGSQAELGMSALVGDIVWTDFRRFRYIPAEVLGDSAPFEHARRVRAWLAETNPRTLEIGRACLRACGETGYPDWYQWSIANWGTKWGAYDYAPRERVPGRFVFKFETAWSFPEPIFRKLAEMATTLDWLIKDDARRRGAAARGEAVNTSEGDWCKHCQSKASCPSKNALLVQVAAGGLAVIGDATMTPARAKGAYEQIVAIEQLVKDARARLNTYVDENGPLDLGDGRAYGRYRRPGNEALDAGVAEQAIREVVGEAAKEFLSVAIERKVTKAGIKRAAEQLLPSGASKTKTAIERRIRELGGVTKKDTYPVGEYDTAKNDAAPVDFPIDEVDAALRSA